MAIEREIIKKLEEWKNSFDKTELVGEQRYSDRLTYDGTWENNLFNFIRLVLPRLTRNLPRPFQMEGMMRKDDTRQHKAVREAVTNAIIHADFFLNGLLRIVKYDDRFEITNPGLLKLPVEQIYAGSETKARNQAIQVMLRMIGYGENIGSGFPLILQAWKEKKWMQPQLIEQPELLQTKLVMTVMTDQAADQTTVEATNRATNRAQWSKLSKKQKDIVKFCQEPRTSGEILDRAGVTNQSYNRQTYIIKLIEAGFLEMTIPERPTDPHQKYIAIKK